MGERLRQDGGDPASHPARERDEDTDLPATRETDDTVESHGKRTQTVILAAGAGTRMRPLTASRPKPLLPVAGRPLVTHTMDAAAAAGAGRFVVVVGHCRDQVREAIGDGHRGVPVEYAVQSRPTGTADAVGVAADHLDRAPFVVLNGDDLYDDGAVATLYDYAGDARPAVGAHPVERPSEYGVLDVAGGHVRAVVEKPADPPTNLVNTGCYRFPAAALDLLDVPESPRGEHELTDVLARVCDRFSVRPVEVDRWQGVGRPWELLAANEWRLSDLDGGVAADATVAPGATLRGAVRVESGARVDPGVVIEGPTLVGEGAHVGPNAYVRGTTLLGPDTRVGHAVEVKNSVLMRNATAAHLSYVGDSVLGADVNLGAGTTIANLRHDGETVPMRVDGERVDTGRRKLGAVLGYGAKTGIDTAIDAGVRLGVGATTAPGETVTEDRL